MKDHVKTDDIMFVIPTVNYFCNEVKMNNLNIWRFALFETWLKRIFMRLSLESQRRSNVKYNLTGTETTTIQIRLCYDLYIIMMEV